MKYNFDKEINRLNTHSYKWDKFGEEYLPLWVADSDFEVPPAVTERHIFYGTFARYGVKSGYKGPIKTVLLENIENDNNELITSHLWFNLTKGFKNLNLVPGDKVKFNGRIKPYIKGYMGRRTDVFVPIEKDYSICYPSQIEIVKRKKYTGEG